MTRLLEFERASRDSLITRLPVKDRVVAILQAVDRLALKAIASGDADAVIDDGQVLAARISIPALMAETGKSEDTVRRALSDARYTPYLDIEPEPGRATVFWLNWPRIMSDQPPAAPPATCGGLQGVVRGVATESAGGSTSKTSEKWHPPQDPPHPSQRVSERDSFSYSKLNNSFTHSLPDLPQEVWDPKCAERRLYEVLGAWWSTEGLADRGHDADAVLGAILAARHNRATSPQSYVARCLATGVRKNWLQQAAAVRRRCRSSTPAAVAAPPKQKTPRMIGPGIVHAK